MKPVFFKGLGCIHGGIPFLAFSREGVGVQNKKGANIAVSICKDFFLQESSASIPWQVAGRHRHLCSLGG